MSRLIYILLLVVTVSSNSSVAAVRLSEPVRADKQSEIFARDAAGAELLLADSQALLLDDVLASPEAYLESNIQLALKVKQVCQKKGCFFIGQQADQSIRVTFQDYGFFVPSDIEGRTVTLVGRLFSNHVSQRQAEHLSRDLKQKNAVTSGQQYEFVASVVRVPFADSNE